MSSPGAEQRHRRCERLAAAQAGICLWCRLPLPDDLADTALDHIIPRARGGPSKVWNRQLLHAVCNKRKGSKLTAQAKELAELHGITLREPLLTAWPGSTRSNGGRYNSLGMGIPLNLQLPRPCGSTSGACSAPRNRLAQDNGAFPPGGAPFRVPWGLHLDGLAQSRAGIVALGSSGLIVPWSGFGSKGRKRSARVRAASEAKRAAGSFNWFLSGS